MKKLHFRPKPLTKILLLRMVSFIHAHPKLKIYVIAVIYKFGLYKATCALYERLSANAYRSLDIPTDFAHLTPRARRIHADLITAIERRQKENI